MENSCSFNPLKPNTDINGVCKSKSTFNPLDCTSEQNNAVQGLLGCDQTAGARALLQSQSDQATQLYGIEIYYYRQDFDPKLSHPIYGDQTAPFVGPYLLKAYVMINTDTSMLTQFGIENQNDVDLQISYEEWAEAFGTFSPQAGDKFEIKDLLCNRPSGFTRAIFQVTSQGDSDLFEASRRWFVSGKRSDFTWLPNEPREDNDNQVHDSALAGLIDNETLEPLPDQSEENSTGRDIDELASEDFRNHNDDVYGGFYIDPDDL